MDLTHVHADAIIPVASLGGPAPAYREQDVRKQLAYIDRFAVVKPERKLGAVWTSDREAQRKAVNMCEACWRRYRNWWKSEHYHPDWGIVGRDAYGTFPTSRQVTTIRGEIRSGNYGGPVVDARGRVITTVFAQRAGTDGGYGVPTSIVRAAIAKAGTDALETRCVDR